MNPPPHTRRDFLGNITSGLGGITLASLLGRVQSLAGVTWNPAFNGGLHHPAKARRVIHAFHEWRPVLLQP